MTLFYLDLWLGNLLFVDCSGREFTDLEQAKKAASAVLDPSLVDTRVEISDSDETLLATVRNQQSC